MARKIQTKAEQQIASARAIVNTYMFGTAEWEAAMEIVRDLVEAQNAAAPKVEYTSIDGDIFDRRKAA